MKIKKIIFSHVLAICLVLTMIMAVPLTASAAISPASKGTITVAGVDENTTVSAYQVITVDVDDTAGQPKAPMFYWVDSVAAWLKSNSNMVYQSYVAADNSVTETFKAAAAEAFKSFWHDLAAEIKSENSDIDIEPIEIKSTGESVVFENMAMGQYLLTAKGGVKIYQPTTAKLIPEFADNAWILNNASVGMKGTMPQIDEKDVIDDDDNTVYIGDRVTYVLKDILVPSYPEDATALKFDIGDKLSAGLTLDADSVKVWTNAELTTPLVNDANINYSISFTPAEGEDYSFKITFTDEFLTEAEVERLYVTYDVLVNEKAFETDSLGNTAFLGYNNDPYDQSSYKTNTIDKDIYTYGINITKVDEDNEPLPGAEFLLYFDEACTQPVNMVSTGTAGQYRRPAAGETNYASSLIVDSDGKLSLQGLDVDTYYLKEVKAPSDYSLPKNPVTVIILADGDDTTAADGDLDTVENIVTGTNVAADSVLVSDNILSLSIQNVKSGFELPETGGIGTVIFTAVGLVLMCGAVAVLVIAAKKKNCKN